VSPVPKLRVALDARSLQDSPIGGVGRSTRALVEAVRGDVDLLLLTDGRRHPVDIDLPQRPLRAPGSGTKAAWLQLAVPAALRGFDGIFHCPWYGLPFRQPVPMVVTIHDLTFEDGARGFWPAQRVAYRVQARWAARTAAHVLTVSETVRQQLCARYRVDPRRVSVHPNAIDRNHMRADPQRERLLRERLGVPGRYVVAVGGAARRRLDLALSAWPTIRARVPDVTLVVMGSEVPDALPAGAVAAGPVDDADWAAALAGASAFVYPTEFEGFGYPALEAMTVGTPIVCAPVGALPEVVGEAGRWFEAPEPAAVADATIAVLTDPALADRLAAAGRVRTSSATALGIVRNRVLDAYEHAASSTRWRSARHAGRVR
jgi:glycosyltransferase involved in cell wall biosynthesis